MTIDLNQYKILVPFVGHILKQHPDMSLSSVANIVSTTAYCPLIVSIFYIAHFKGMTDELKTVRDEIMTYYQYDKILNVEEFVK